MKLKGRRQSKNVLDHSNQPSFVTELRKDAVSKEYQGTNLTEKGQKKSLKKRGAEYQRFKSAVKDMEDDPWVPVNTRTTAPLYGVKKTQVTPGKWTSSEPKARKTTGKK